MNPSDPPSSRKGLVGLQWVGPALYVTEVELKELILLNSDEKTKMLRTSAVYRRKDVFGDFSKFVMMIEIESEMESKEVFKMTESLREQLLSQAPRSQLEVRYLCEESAFQLRAHQVLPDPELHLKPWWLVPAAGLWPNYHHPVLGKSLVQVCGEHQLSDWGVFEKRLT